MVRPPFIWICWLCLLVPIRAKASPDFSEPPAKDPNQVAQQRQFFESRVRPLLVEHCQSCHGPAKQKGELRLDSKMTILKGGESGPSVVPGKPGDSLLIKAVHYDGLEMPPKGKLPADKIRILESWVKSGAYWPEENAPGGSTGASPDKSTHKTSTQEITTADRNYWAFKQVRRPEIPEPKSGPKKKNPIDSFVERRLEAAGILPNGPATSRELVRRVFFDLTGLPPTHAETLEWTRRIGNEPQGGFNESEYRLLVDQLLERPAYGEHWGRHWLDVVRFAQSNGYERDGYKPMAWRYRDYVINAFQKDKPYNLFIEEQLAGDELPNANAEYRTATGFYRLGAWDDEPDDKRQAEFEELDDVLVATGASFLGLTLGCARCHEHKFDPIPHADYYRLLAYIRNIRPYANPEKTQASSSFLPVSSDAAIQEALQAWKDRQEKRLADIKNAKNDAERKRLETEKVPETLEGLEWTLGVKNRAEPLPTHVLVRGNAATPGQEVRPGIPQVFVQAGANGESPDPGKPPGSRGPVAKTRLELARWIASRDNPLTARVMVNRLWHYHFGRGIVATTGDFGKAGVPPTHPDLLDWLAAEFMDKGWSVKAMHRTILLSETYRRASRVPEGNAGAVALQKDPGNTLLWRQNLRRLEAESIRDSMLAVSGELNPRQGGQEMFPRLSGEVLAGQSKPGLDWDISEQEERNRRSVYGIVKRGVRDPLLEAFDYANTVSPLTERPVTTVAPQALILLNDRFTLERASALAERIGNKADAPRDRIRELFRDALQRDPSSRESELALEYLERTEASFLPLAGSITFRPDVPESLYSAYRQKLPGADYLLGPPGWSYAKGRWGGGYEGIDVVDPLLGPFALWQGDKWRDGAYSGRMRLDPATRLVTLMARGRAEADAWNGIAITLDKTAGQVLLRERHNNQEKITRARMSIPVEQWIPFRFQVEGDQVRFWLSDNTKGPPLVEATVAKSSLPPGRLGVAVWGGGVTLDGLELVTGGRKMDVVRSAVTAPVSMSPAGWKAYGGNWSLREDGILAVEPALGPKLIWEQEYLKDGEVSVEMRFAREAAAIGGLVLRVSEPKEGADNWFGHEVSFDFGGQKVFLGDHRNNWTPLVDKPVVLKADTWHKLRVKLQGKRLQVFVDDASAPALDREVEPPLPGVLVGLRTWGSAIEYRNLQLTREGKKVSAKWVNTQQVQNKGIPSDQQWARRKALEALCQSVLNLNEFVYVD